MSIDDTNYDERQFEAKRTTELDQLVTQWKKERTYRDAGIAAKKTWQRIKSITTIQQQINLLEEALFLAK